MNKEELTTAVMAALRTYIDDEEMYDDNAQLLVNPATMEVSLDDGDEYLH